LWLQVWALALPCKQHSASESTVWLKACCCFVWPPKRQSAAATTAAAAATLPQGGPGCSSLFGTFYLNGPFALQTDLTLQPNPGRWNRQYGMLFVDQPIGTGFSVAGGAHCGTQALVAGASTQPCVGTLHGPAAQAVRGTCSSLLLMLLLFLLLLFRQPANPQQ
jgi:hypothetical protein